MLKVLAIIGCLALVIFIWSLIKWLPCGKCWIRKEIADIPGKESPVITRTNTILAVEDSVHFLPDGNDEIKNLGLGDIRSVSEREYFSQTSRDLSWLDMWQTKAHRRTEFAKSMTALILPKSSDSNADRDDHTITPQAAINDYDEADCERELLVVPANMTSGMCDHNLAMGLFLWSPSKNKSRGAIEEERVGRKLSSIDSIRTRQGEEKARGSKAGAPRSLCLFPNCACGNNHTPLSPLTAMSSATVSELSSVKSSPSVTCSSVGYPHQRSSHRSEIRGNMILTEVQEKLGRYVAAPYSPTLSPSSSSASVLSPPPPSTETCSMSPQYPPNMGSRRKAFNEQCVKATYPLRYNRGNGNVHPTVAGQSRTLKLINDYSNISTLSSPTVVEEAVTPQYEERKGVFADEVEQCASDQFQSPYE